MRSNTHLNLNGFCDADREASQDRRSITGYAFHLSQNGPRICWKYKKQPTVALSTCEAEYKSICAAVQEAKFLMQLLKDMTVERVNESAVLKVDSQSAMALAKNPVFHQRSNHIDIRYDFLRNEIQNGFVQLKYVPSEDNIVGILTKALSDVIPKHFVTTITGAAE
jgi:hypothetical protein